jgi:hypothetical protein
MRTDRWPMTFELFQEAVTVLQMAHVIDRDPLKCSVLCPHLPARTVWAVLSVRRIDDDLKKKPDLDRFAREHRLGTVVAAPLQFDTDHLIDFNDTLPTDNWKDVSIGQGMIQSFPFLAEYFGR